jgi:hypothetical protein
VTSPKRGIGHQTLAGLGTLASQYKLSLFEALFSNSLGAKLSARAVGSLHEFGRYMNDLEYRAKRTHGAEDAKAFLLQWLQEIGYEKHLYDGEDNEKVAAARWTNVLEFCDWMAGRCGGTIGTRHGVGLGDVATRWVIDQAQVGSAIMGFTSTRYLPATQRIEALRLDAQDNALLTPLLARRTGPAGDCYDIERDKEGRHGRIMRYNQNVGRH